MPQTVKNTGKKVVYAGKSRTVYQGTRGGLYVKKDGKYVSVAKKTMMGGDMTPQVKQETEKYAAMTITGRHSTTNFPVLGIELLYQIKNRTPNLVNKDYLINLLNIAKENEEDRINNLEDKTGADTRSLERIKYILNNQDEY